MRRQTSRKTHNGALTLGIALATLGSALVISGATPANAQTLQQALGYAMETNPDVGEARANRRATDLELKQARGLYLPQVDVEASIGPQWRDEPLVGSDDSTRKEVFATVRQPIFSGFANKSEVDRQASRVDAAASRVFERTEEVALNISNAYLDALRQQELVALGEQNVRTHEARLSQVQQRFDAGDGPISDVQQARERLSAAQNVLVNIRRDLSDAQVTFESLVGTPPANLSMPPDLTAGIPSSREDAAAAALGNSPQIASANADLDTANADFRASGAPFYPTLDLEASARLTENVESRTDDAIVREANVLLVARYNLFRGFIDQANRQEQVERISEAQFRVIGARRAAVEEAQLAWNDRQTAIDTIALLEQEVASSRDVRDSYADEFNVGRRTLLDLLDADNQLFNSRAALVTARFSKIFADHRILASTGDLLSALDVARPEETVGTRRDENNVVPTQPIFVDGDG
ncbi:MAG: TolC family outer membrane protein [Pseudomonadota bacterium]